MLFLASKQGRRKRNSNYDNMIKTPIETGIIQTPSDLQAFTDNYFNMKKALVVACLNTIIVID